MTDEAPIVPLSTKLRCADETLRMVIESVFAKRGIPATDVFFTLLKRYGIPYWSAATAAQRHTVEEALDKAMLFSLCTGYSALSVTIKSVLWDSCCDRIGA